MTQYKHMFHAGGKILLGWCDQCGYPMSMYKDAVAPWPTKLPNGDIVCNSCRAGVPRGNKTSFIQP